MKYLLGQGKITHTKQLGLTREEDFLDCATYTCLCKAFQDFIVK